MRAGVAAVLMGVVLMFGVALAPSASAKDTGGFLDLPGFGAVERLTDTKAPAAVSGTGTTTSQRVTATDRAPAPDATKALKAAVTSDDKSMIRSLPGGRHIPVIGVDAAAARRGSDGIALALGSMVVVLFTRFLFRLNTLGRAA